MPPSNTVRQPSGSTGVSIFYITVGVLLTIWASIWYYFLSKREDASEWAQLVCLGLLLSGIALGVIGVLVGRIGREAQNADVPVGQVTGAVVQPTDGNGQPLPPAQVQPGQAVPPRAVAQATPGPVEQR